MDCPLKQSYPSTKDLTLSIVGSNKFGRFPKISIEETINMIIADGWLVPFAGYKARKSLLPESENVQGRGIYSSEKLGKLFICVHNFAFSFDKNLSGSLLGTLDTFSGDVFIEENNNGQVVFSDSTNLYVFNSNTESFTTLTQAVLGFRPGYITFQDERIISPDLETSFWQLSAVGDATLWPADAQHVGKVSTKSTNAVGCIRFPGRGNLLMVFGTNVAEQWTDNGAQLFPYQRSQSTNTDFGCINPATIASNENMVCWVGTNEQSGPAIMFTRGSEVEKISTDGIDNRLSQLENPENCYGYMVRLGGHILYVVTWVKDNITYAYDFETKSFFTLCSENMNAFIVRRIAFFNNTYYFVSLVDGNLYELSDNFFTYDYGNGEVHEIPYIRVINNVRDLTQERVNYPYVGFTIEQGNIDYKQQIGPNTQPRIDLTISKDGGINFGNTVSRYMYKQGNRKNRLMWWQLGSANDLVCQFRFYVFGRALCTDGILGVSQ
jgi:hypothetical protein